jgi:hypothetical protein
MKPARAVEIVRELSSTRYHLLVVEDSDGGLIVTWPDGRWWGWASSEQGGRICSWSPKIKGRSPSSIDIANIANIVDEARAELRLPGGVRS